MTRTIYDDPVIAEIHSIRQSLLEECGGDIVAYRQRVREQQDLTKRQVIRKPFRDRTGRRDAPERE